ncbi:MAG: nucleotidyltransferase family protein [Desulfobulbaceae bacterium]|nr:nucleotidyltransferase family protein [Desulfobulbaceae bacterium]
MTPEKTILRCCAHAARDPEQINRLRNLLNDTPIDWPALLLMAARHKILPLLFLNLKRCGRQAVPKPVWAQLKTLYVSNGVRNLYLAYVLKDIVRLFHENSIQALPFKGPVLTLAAYGSLALRNFLDLDILIAKRDLAKAATLLQEAGYRPRLDLDGAQFSAFAATEDNFSFMSEDGLVTVELHWELSGRYLPRPLDFEKLRPYLEAFSFKGAEMLTLCPEVLLVYLCVHGAKHKWDCLDLICCISELMKKHPQLDWELIFSFAAEIGAVRMVRVGLLLARDVLGTTVPRRESVIKLRDEDRQAERLAAEVAAGIFVDDGTDCHSLASSRFAFWHLQCRDRWVDGCGYLLRLFLTPTVAEWQWLRLPAGLSFLYYFLRPFRLLVEFGQGLLRRRAV